MLHDARCDDLTCRCADARWRTYRRPSAARLAPGGHRVRDRFVHQAWRGRALAYDTTYDGRVLPGVRVGIDLSGSTTTGLSRSTAFPYDDGRVGPHGRRGRRGLRGVRWQAGIGHGRAAMAAGRAGTPFQRAIAEVRMALDPVSLGCARA
jgi:hypothetical protein